MLPYLYISDIPSSDSFLYLELKKVIVFENCFKFNNYFSSPSCYSNYKQISVLVAYFAGLLILVLVQANLMMV